MKKTGVSLGTLAGEMKHFPQVMLNIKINPKFREVWKNDTIITGLIENCEQTLGDTGKICVRENPDEGKL